MAPTSIMMDELHRPLGRDAPRRRERRPLPLRALGLAAGIAALAAGSAATALLQPPLRHVDVFAEAAAREAERQAASATAAADVKIIAGTPLKPLGASPSTVRGDEPGLPTITYPPGTSGTFGREIAVSDPASMRQAASDAARPDEALLEAGEHGPLPARARDGRRPFDVYQTAPSSEAGTRIAIVVGGLGISQTGTQKAIRSLPAGVTLAFAPAGNSLDRWMREARTSGHELLLQAPLEPFGYPASSPGEHTQTMEDAAAGRFADLHWALSRLTNYVGVMNYMGARITADPAATRALMGEMTKRGLLYLDDGSSARSLARDGAREAGAVFAQADVLIDGEQDPAAIRRRLETLERVARADGRAVGIASAFDLSVGAIADWIEGAEARGIRIVPVSALADDPENR